MKTILQLMTVSCLSLFLMGCVEDDYYTEVSHTQNYYSDQTPRHVRPHREAHVAPTPVPSSGYYSDKTPRPPVVHHYSHNNHKHKPHAPAAKGGYYSDQTAPVASNGYTSDKTPGSSNGYYSDKTKPGAVASADNQVVAQPVDESNHDAVSGGYTSGS